MIEKGNSVTDIIIEILMLIIFAITFLNITSRFIFGNSWNWTGELSRYIFIWASFITGSISIKKKDHLGIGDGLIRKIPEKWKTIIDIFGSLLAIVFAFILIIYGYKTSSVLIFKKTPVLLLPMGYVTSIIAISGFLFVLNLSLDVIKEIKKLRIKVGN